MPFDQPAAVEIDLIVMTDDRAHARDLLAGLDRELHQYTIHQISKRDSMESDLEAAIEDAGGKRPVIVFLDCEFLKGQAEMIAARLLALKRALAIECVATRPPVDGHRRAHLALLGVHLFDGWAPSAEIIPLH